MKESLAFSADVGNIPPSEEVLNYRNRVVINGMHDARMQAAAPLAQAELLRRGVQVRVEVVDYALESIKDTDNEGNAKPFSNEQGLMHQLRDGAVGAVAGIDKPTGDVLKASFYVVGAKKEQKRGNEEPKGLISSFFAMKHEGQEIVYLGDCAVNPKPTAAELAMIAEQTYKNVAEFTKRTEKGAVVAFLRAPKAADAGPDIIDEALEIFRANNPDIPDKQILGALTWEEARAQGANALIFPGLNSGNIGYKAAQYANGGNWNDTQAGGDIATVLEKDGEKLYLSKCEQETPTAEELAAMAIQNFDLARNQNPDEEPPVVAMLSFSTEGSSQAAEAWLVEDAHEIVKRQRPDIVLVGGPVQWDSATKESAYHGKSFDAQVWDGGVDAKGRRTTKTKYPEDIGNHWPERNDGTYMKPTVLICPDRDSSAIIPAILKDAGMGDQVAVGPILQGLDEVPDQETGEPRTVRVVDLSRGASIQDIVDAILVAAGEAP